MNQNGKSNATRFMLLIMLVGAGTIAAAPEPLKTKVVPPTDQLLSRVRDGPPTGPSHTCRRHLKGSSS